MTTRASIIGDTRVDSSLEIVYMLRRYELMRRHELTRYSKRPPPRDDTSMRQDEFISMMETFEKTPEDRLWRALRGVNKIAYSKYFNTLRKLESTSTQELTFAPSSPQDEYAKPALTNMLNMLSWYKFDSTMQASTSTSAPTIAASTSLEKDNKWRLRTEVAMIFNKALDDTFPEFTEKCMMLRHIKDGHFQSENFLSIWPKIKTEKIKSKNNRYPDIKGPKDVGMRIKEALAEPKNPMIEGEPRVYDIGCVTIKLSVDWMVENIRNMLREGMDTWAPRQQLEFKSTIVNSPSWDESNLMPMDVLRRQLIIMTRMHMLEYVNSNATTSLGNGMSFPPMKLNEHFRTVEENGEMLIYVKDEDNMKPLIRGKSRNGKSLGERDGCLGYPLEDLAALWHGLVSEKADWIVCVTPTQQQDYIENCFKAAEHAGWTTDSFWPLGTYVGFKTCSTSLEDLLSFLYEAQYPCEAGEAAKVLGYTHEAVLDCALTYTFLKSHRLADCKFSYNEMLDIKGDTFVYLLTTQARIRNITNHSRKDMDELKKASKLVLEEDKVAWSEGVERELGLHLLMFTEIINESYLSFMPHLLSGYLFDLCNKFSRFYQTYASSGFEAKTRLLLCEASAVVMEKGFHLLGITQKPSLQAVSVALALNYVSPLEVRNLRKHPNVRTRFEVFTTYLHITRDHKFRGGNLFGNIQVDDYYGLRPGGWAKLCHPGPGRVSLLSRDWQHSVEMQNNGRLKIGDPSSKRSVPFSSSMRIYVLLYATTKNNDEFFEVCNHRCNMNFSTFLDKDSDGSAEYLIAEGDDGHIRMHYILLRNAVDATIKVKLKFGKGSGRKVSGKILAYYDKFDYGDDNLVKSFYKASLWESFDGILLEGGDVSLTRSILAVPINDSLIIEARLTDSESGVEILNGSCKFRSDCKGTYNKDIKCNDNTLEVEITWNQD